MCISPITLMVVPKSSDKCIYSKPKVVKVPCGHCIECLRDKQNSWYVRLWSEFQGKDCLFFTLTYRNDSVPFNVDEDTGECFNTVCQRHLQTAFKRFRTNFERKHGYKLDCKYFICSEYGPRSLRPHYHGIINLSKQDFLPFLLDWQQRYGFTQCSKVRSLGSSLNYITKYAIKGSFDNPYIQNGLVKKNFRLISKRIGYNWIKEHLYLFLHPEFTRKMAFGRYRYEYLDTVINSLKICLPNGFVYKLPQYFKEIIFQKSPLLSAQIKARIQEKFDSIRVRELAELQTSMSEREAIQVLAQTEIQVFYEKIERSKEKKRSYARFLMRSAI